ncbi:hypothetical protein AQUCO_02300037v1 [Aquilegia coerulea]|uniref:Uncharacterized protein n=1 Tax=Aquilegia coerulea TaxID=218851 RepID=A0A2G5DBY6_AQUCA|nr:hypothetical protein AQUCO_02300037v1 [Aquilegia coerulea]
MRWYPLVPPMLFGICAFQHNHFIILDVGKADVHFILHKYGVGCKFAHSYFQLVFSSPVRKKNLQSSVEMQFSIRFVVLEEQVPNYSCTTSITIIILCHMLIY